MPFFKKILTPQNATIGIWQITETIADLQPLVNLPHPTFPSQRRLKEWLAVRALLGTLLATRDFEIDYDPKGKPFFKKRTLQVSITHSRAQAAVILHPTKTVGIDIEPLRAKIDKVKHKFLSNQELAALPQGDIKGYITYWCAKEALYKWYGKRGLEFKEHLILKKNTVDGAPLKAEGTLDAVVQKGDFLKKLDVDYQSIAGEVMTYVVG